MGTIFSAWVCCFMLTIFLFLCGVACAFRAIVLYRRLRALTEGLYPQPLRITSADQVYAVQVLGSFESISFTTQDGLTLRAWYKPSQNGAAVIFIHGKSNNRHTLIEEAAAVVRLGMGVLLYDSRASGESDGRLHSWGALEQLDLAAALDYLESRRDVDSNRIGIHGFSVGANTALLLAVKDQRVKALVLSGACPSLAEYLHHISSKPKILMAWLLLRQYKNAGVPVAKINLTENIARFAPRPLLMIRGTGSVTVPIALAQNLFDAADEPKMQLVIEGADHMDFVQVGGPKYLSAVADFFNRYL